MGMRALLVVGTMVSLVAIGHTRGDVVIDSNESLIRVGGWGEGIAPDEVTAQESNQGGHFDHVVHFNRTGDNGASLAASCGMESDVGLTASGMSLSVASATGSVNATGTAAEPTWGASAAEITVSFTTTGNNYAYDLGGELFAERGGYAQLVLSDSSGTIEAYGASFTQWMASSGVLTPGSYTLHIAGQADVNAGVTPEFPIGGFAKVNFTLTHMPEPASMALLAFCAPMILRRRRA